MKPTIIQPDAERIAVDYLTERLAVLTETVEVGIDVPEWAEQDYLQVALDGTPTVSPPLYIAQLRVTAWAKGKTRAKALAALAQGLLLAHPGGDGCAGCLPGPGISTTQDSSTGAQLATAGVRMKLRGSTL